MPENDDPFQEFGGQQVAADPGDPFAEFGGQELKKKETSSNRPNLGSLVGSVLGSGGLSTSKTKAHELGAVVGKSVSRPKSISHGIEQDKEATSTIGGIYNTIVGSLSRLAGGIGEMASWRDPVQIPTGLGITPREVGSSLVEKIRTSASSKENEQKLTSFNFADGVDWSDVGGVLASAPSQVLDIGLGVYSGGGSFVAQAVNDAAKEIDENPNAKDLTPMQKIGYVSAQAFVQTALDKIAVGKVFKGTGIAKGVVKKLTGEIVSEFAEKGIKATAAQIEKAAFKKVAALASKIKNVGIKAATGFAYEGGTEGLQQAGSDGIKLLTNKFKDKEIFDEQDIKQNFAKNVLNAGVAGGIFGGVAGGGAAALQNTNKAIRNEVANGADYEQVRQQIAEQVEQGNITPEEAKAADITAQQYAEIASKIPTEIDPEKKYAIIGGISQRESLSKEIELAKEEILKADPAFRREQLDKLDLLEAKLGQTNDYIEGLILDKKPEYKKEGDTYIKIDGNGQQTEISKEHFDLAEAVEQKVSRETSSVEQTITPIPIDEVETHESVLKRAKTGQSIEIEALRIQKSDKTNDNTGVFFADKGIIEEYRKREESGFYGEENKGLFSGDVKKHTLSFKNPLVVRNKFSWLQELAKNGDKEVQDVMPNYKDEYVFGTSHETYDALDTFVAKKARELGYDGIISPLEYIALDNKSFKPVNKPTPTKEELLGGESIVGDKKDNDVPSDSNVASSVASHTSGVGNSVGKRIDKSKTYFTINEEDGKYQVVMHSKNGGEITYGEYGDIDEANSDLNKLNAEYQEYENKEPVFKIAKDNMSLSSAEIEAKKLGKNHYVTSSKDGKYKVLEISNVDDAKLKEVAKSFEDKVAVSELDKKIKNAKESLDKTSSPIQIQKLNEVIEKLEAEKNKIIADSQSKAAAKPNSEQSPERSVASEDAQGTEPTPQNKKNEPQAISTGNEGRATEDGEAGTGKSDTGLPINSRTSAEDAGNQGNGAPPSGEGVAADEKQPKGNKSLANRLVDASNLSKEVKDGIAKEGLSYAPRSHKEAEDIAKSIIDTEGIDSAVLQARAQTFGGDVNTLIQTEALNRLFDLENKATTKEEKLEHAKKFAEIGIELDKWAREKAGRGISALAYFYKKSPIGIQMMENAKRKEDFEQWSKPKDKSWKEFFDEMMKEPEFAVQVKEELKKERQDARKERIKKVDDSIDKLIDDIESGKAAFSSVVPPPIIIAALKTAKAAYHAGESVAKIIQDAVDFVTEKMGGATWDSEKFRKKAEELLKENEPKKKLTDEELKAKILDRFRKKLKGLSSKEQEEIIRRSFKEIVENGGLQYDDFKKIIAEVTGRGEMTAEEAVRIKELVEKTNAVDDAAKKAQADRTEESLTKYRAAQLQAAAAGKELNELLNTRPNIIKRLTSIMQLNTLGIAALVNNPIYNIWNQATLRLPIGMVNTVLEQGIKLVKKDYVPETNFIFAQKEFFSKLGLGTRESIGQIWSGLNRMDYIQKELYGQQIKPLKSAQDLWDFHQGKINLTKQQVTDKIIQALPNAWFAEAVARALNVGDKPQRFGAEGAQASVFAKNLGLKDIDYKLFIEFPKEEAYAAYKKQGLSDNEAAKKSEYVKDVIIREGERSTFQQDNMLNDALTKMFGGEKSGVGSLAKAVLVSPYLKIPLNAYWSYYNLINPEVAFLQSAIYGTRAYKNRNKGDNTSAKQFHEAKYWFAHGVVGIATRAVVLGLVSAGIFVPKNDEDDTKKEREGEQNYQRQGGINMTKLKALLNGKNPDDVKDGLIADNRWWGHFGTIGNAIAKKNEEMTPAQFKEQRAWWDAIFGGMEVDAIKDLNQGVFSNTSSLFSALNEGGINAQRWSLSTINLFTNIVQPASVAQISRAQLPYQASNKADTFLGQVKNQMLQRSSWLRKLTGEYPPSKISIWGDEMKTNDNAAMKMFGISDTNKDAFAYPLFEDYQKTKDIGFFPPAVLPTLNKIKLNTEQTRKLETYIGQARKDFVAPYVNDMAEITGFNKKYSQIEDEETKKRILQYLYSQGRAVGVSRFIKEYPDFKKAEETAEEELEDKRMKALSKKTKKAVKRQQ